MQTIVSHKILGKFVLLMLKHFAQILRHLAGDSLIEEKIV